MATPSRASHTAAMPIATHSAVVSAGQGEASVNNGAKKNPSPMYQAEPARSQIRTNRIHGETALCGSVFGRGSPIGSLLSSPYL